MKRDRKKIKHEKTPKKLCIENEATIEISENSLSKNFIRFRENKQNNNL